MGSRPPEGVDRSPTRGRAIRRVVGGVLTALCLAGCNTGVLAPRGPVGEGERTILFDAVAIMLTIAVPAIVATLLFAWWFRASNPRARRLPKWAFSGQLEIVIWAVPLLTIMFLGGLNWISSHQLDPYRPLPSKTKPLEVQVVSMDWKWLFIYPDRGIASVNALTAPAGAPIHFTLTSASVMNTFFVPQLGSMIYTMNGMATQLNLQADQPGVYPGLSGDFSGDGFATMHFNVNAVTPAQFASWAASVKGKGPTLDPAAYGQLAKQSADVAPFTYGAVTPGLFQAVVTQAIAPGPGPATEKPSTHVFPKPLEAR
jgi:cytochrome o ubiquinol oxidase subunit 2